MNTVEEKLKAAKNTAPAGAASGYKTQAQQAAQNPLEQVSGYLAPAANVESVLNEAKTQRETAAAANRDALLGNIGQMYTTGVQKVNTAADEAQRQNYIAQQLQQRNMGQQMAANGMTGGATETAMLALANAYGDNRRQTEQARMEQVAALEDSRAQQETAAHTAYNDSMAAIASDIAAQIAAARQAETDRQAQLLMQKFNADQSAAQAEAERLWQGQQAEADRNFQQQMTEYDWAQKLAEAAKDREFQQSQNEYDWAQKLAQAEAERLWQGQQAEADRAFQKSQNEYDWAQQFAMSDKEIAAQLQLAAQKAASGGSSGAVTANNYYSKLDVPYTQMAGFAQDIETAQSGIVDKKMLKNDAAELIDAYGAKGYEYLVSVAPETSYTHGLTKEQQKTADLIANALAASAQEQARANAMFR